MERKAIHEFVMGQPDDRPVNMEQPEWNSPCGCVMVHLAREEKLPTPFHCAFSCVTYDHKFTPGRVEGLDLGLSIRRFFVPQQRDILEFVGTYGELKAKLLPLEELLALRS